MITFFFVSLWAGSWRTVFEASEMQSHPFWFQRCVTHYGAVDDSFADYLAAVKPQVAVCGNFGPNYWAAASYARDQGLPTLWTPLGGGPVDRGWWERFIRKAHRRRIKVVGMFSLTCTYGDPEKPAGFFKFYDQEWDEELLGPRPISRARDLMQKKANGSLWEERVYRIEAGGEYWGCPNNPLWRSALQGMVTAALSLGLDGFITIFPLRHDCTCDHCQEAFRRWLSSRSLGRPEEVERLFQITDLARHRFSSINGWYEPAQASLYALECLKFSQSALKDCFDEVLIGHGRKIKPDLILGQWNHIYRSSYQGPGQLAGTFAQLNADERCVLPSDRWSQGEDFVWYSIGNRPLYDEPSLRSFGCFILEYKYLYEAGGGKPAGIKTDDPVRVRLSIAEAAANAGFAYPRGPNYRDPATGPIVEAYFDFLRRHEQLYHPVKSYAEAALVWNRRAVHRGDSRHIADFKHLGQLLVKNHVLFDVILDENLGSDRLSRYRLVLLPETQDLTPGQRSALLEFLQAGGKVVICGESGDSEFAAAGAKPLPSAELQAIPPTAFQDFGPYLDEWLPLRSNIVAADSVGFTCFQQPATNSISEEAFPEGRRRLIVHLVNYRRDRRGIPGVQGAALERPVTEEQIFVKLRLPAGWRAKSVKLYSPETFSRGRTLKFGEVHGPAVLFHVPELYVYAVASLELESRQAGE